MTSLLQQVERGEIAPPKNLVALAGERRRGKDHLTSSLIQKYGALRLSFSDEVRNLAQTIFPWFNAYMPDDQKEQVYDHPYNTTRATGRDIILMAGKARDVDSRYFVRSFIENQFQSVILQPDRLHVITDFRTLDEYEAFLQPLQVPIIRILRDVDLPPHPFEEYLRNFKDYDATFHNCLEGTAPFLDFFSHFSDQYGLVYNAT